VRIHFGTNGKIAGADIETCKYCYRCILQVLHSQYIHSTCDDDEATVCNCYKFNSTKMVRGLYEYEDAPTAMN